MVTRKKRQTNLLHDTTTGTVNIGHSSSAQRPNIGFFGSGFTNTRGSSRKRRRRRQQAIAQQRAKERARVEALARAEAQARDRAIARKPKPVKEKKSNVERMPKRKPRRMLLLRGSVRTGLTKMLSAHSAVLITQKATSFPSDINKDLKS